MQEQFWPENYSHRGRDELAVLHQFRKETVADFFFRFHAICLKTEDLSEAEKLDRFVHALSPDIRLQIELRGLVDFHEAAMFVEHADAVISCFSGQDTQKNWQHKQFKGGS